MASCQPDGSALSNGTPARRKKIMMVKPITTEDRLDQMEFPTNKSLACTVAHVVRVLVRRDAATLPHTRFFRARFYVINQGGETGEPVYPAFSG